MNLQTTQGYQIVLKWLAAKGFQPFAFQEKTWKEIAKGNSGIVNAPTGCGKTFSVFLGSIIQFINQNPENYFALRNNGLQLLWITPLRALAKRYWQSHGRSDTCAEPAVASGYKKWRYGCSRKTKAKKEIRLKY